MCGNRERENGSAIQPPAREQAHERHVNELLASGRIASSQVSRLVYDKTHVLIDLHDAGTPGSADSNYCYLSLQLQGPCRLDKDVYCLSLSYLGWKHSSIEANDGWNLWPRCLQALIVV